MSDTQGASPEVRRAVQAGIEAYTAAKQGGMGEESAFYFSKLAFEAQFEQEARDRKIMLAATTPSLNFTSQVRDGKKTIGG